MAGALPLVTMLVLVIPGWADLQHYKTRSAPWVKLYVKTLREPRYRALSASQRGLLADLWRLAVETENKTPADCGWLAHKLGITEPIQPMLDVLLAGRHIVSASIGASGALTLSSEYEVQSLSPSRGESERGDLASHNGNGGEDEIASPQARADFLAAMRELHREDFAP
jgi:hypothetical protein